MLEGIKQMDSNPCEAISKKTYLPCKLRARQGFNTCTAHKDFFTDTWKEYFIYQQNHCLYVIYTSPEKIMNLQTVANEIRIGHHIRKVLQDKLVTLTVEDIHRIPVQEAYSDLFLYLMECETMDIVNYPEILACVLSMLIRYITPKTFAKELLSEKMRPFMENKSFEFTEKLLLICTLITDYYTDKDYYEVQNEFPRFHVFLDEVFKYYNNEFDNESKEKIKEYLIRFPAPVMDKFFEENIVPRLTNLK